MSRPRTRSGRFGWDLGVLVLVVATLVLGGVVNPDFTSGSNLGFVVQDIGEVMLLAVPMTFIIITGEIDLSVASTMALTSCVLGRAFDAGLPMGAAVVLALLCGALAGAFNGLLITRLGLSSLAVTIGTLGLFRGLSYALLGDQPVADFPTGWTDLGYQPIPGTYVPWVAPLLVVVVVAAGFFLHGTRSGRWIFAIGQSPEAARFAGIPVETVKLRLFVLSGTVAALAGVVYSLRFASARPDAAVGFELAVIASVLFGGVSIFGGVGALWGVVGAVLFLGAVRSLLQLENVPPNALTIITGGLLLTSVVVPALLGALAARRSGRPLEPREHTGAGVPDPVGTTSTPA